jgi:hypothetical protein
VRKGLLVGVQRTRVLTRQRAPVGGLLVSAGELEVVRDQARRRSRVTPPAAAPGQRLGDAPVQQAPAWQAGLLVRQRAQLLVAEVVGDRGPLALVDLLDQPAREQLLQCGDRLLLAAPARLADQLEVEGAADDRRGGEQLPAGLADRAEPPAQQLADPAGQGRSGHPSALPGHGGQVLDQEERQALGLPVQVVGGVSTARRHRPDQLGHLRLAKAPQEQAAGRARALRLRQQAAQAVPPRHLLASPGRHDRQPLAAQPPDQVGEQVERGVVGPVQVVEQEHARAGTGQRGQQRLAHALEEAALRAGAVQRGGRRQVPAQLREVGQEAGGLGEPVAAQLRHPPPGAPPRQGRPQALDERRVGELALLLVAA